MSDKNTILLKRTKTKNLIPSIQELNEGEIFVQVNDGKIFIKQVNDNDEKIVNFLNSNDYPYTLDKNLSSIVINYGNNNVTEVLSNILGGYNNFISGAGSVIINGENNQITSDFGFIGSGYNNTINPDGEYSAILGGKNNKITHKNSFTIGSNLTSDRENFTYINNISGVFWGDGSNITSNVWDSVYTTVQSNSAEWESTYNKVNNLTIADVSNLQASLTATSTTTSTFQVKAVSQGIYNDGTTIPAGTSLETIIRNMLTTRVFPTYNAPLLSVSYGSPSISTTYEVGFTIPTFTINPTYTPRDGGPLIGYAYLRNNSLLGNGSTFTVNSFQINSTTTLQVSARYGDGPIYNDNLGNPYPDTSIKANSIINTLTINTLYPYFYGKSSTQPTTASIAAAIQAGTATKVLADATGTVSITYNANGEFIWFAHLGTQTTKQKWYFAEFNSGNIENGNFINTPVNQNVTSPENYWTSVQYKIYISSGQSSTTGALAI